MPRIIRKLFYKDSLIFLNMHNQIFSNSFWKEEYWNSFLSSHQKPIFCALKKKGGYIGFILGKPLNKTSSIILLDTLLILPEYRKHGYGKELLIFFLQTIFALPTTKKVILHFRESNKEKLLPYYKKFGFSNYKVCGKYTNNEIKYYLFLTKKAFIKNLK